MVISLGADRKYSISIEDIYWSAKKLQLMVKKTFSKGHMKNARRIGEYFI